MIEHVAVTGNPTRIDYLPGASSTQVLEAEKSSR
ncbi:MAG: hypothetical protein ACI92S_005037, partial [Planctomycetaceae bacterium]